MALPATARRDRELRVAIRPNWPQFQALQALAPRRTIFCGFGRGVGKTFLLRAIWYRLIAEWDGRVREHSGEQIRGVRIIPIMPTLKQFKDVYGSDLIEELSPGGKWGWLGAHIDKTRWQITFPGGSWIKPFPASEYNSRTARGMRCDVISPDEVDDIDADVYDSVAVPWLSAPWSLGMELPSGTPTRGRHGLWYRFLQAGKLGSKLRKGLLDERYALRQPTAAAIIEVLRALPSEFRPDDLEAAALDALKSNYAFHATYRDAPDIVSPTAVARARASTTEATFRREWEADPDAGEGLVYPFDEHFHVREVPRGVTFSEYIVGVDHGYTDPGVYVLIGIAGSGANAFAWVLDEIYETEQVGDWWLQQARTWSSATQRDSQWIKRALARPSAHLPYYCDPSRPDVIKSLQAAGINAMPAQNAIDAGITCVANLMVKRFSEAQDLPYARFYVRPNCINTIREFGSYRRKKRTDGTFDERPEDKDNHVPDAARYALISRFGSGAGGKTVTPR